MGWVWAAIQKERRLCAHFCARPGADLVASESSRWVRKGVETPMFPTAVKFNYFDARAVMLNQSVYITLLCAICAPLAFLLKRASKSRGTA